jgi:hypothetical protein
MCPMNYRPGDKIDGGGRAEPGTYVFRVDEARETTFKTGTEGAEVTLMVGAFTDRDIKVFERFAYMPKALWKLEQFMNAIGEDFAHPGEIYDLVGKTGRAEFEHDEKGYLRVKEYIPANANNGPDSKPTQRTAQRPPPHPSSGYRQPEADKGPPPHSDDDCPF